MSSSKSIVSSIAAAAAVTVIGLAYAQTSPYSSNSSAPPSPPASAAPSPAASSAENTGNSSNTNSSSPMTTAQNTAAPVERSAEQQHGQPPERFDLEHNWDVVNGQYRQRADGSSRPQLSVDLMNESLCPVGHARPAH